MKKGFYLFASVFQLLVGMAGIAAFVILAADGEIEIFSKWTITVVLAVCFFIIGLIGIKDYKSTQ